MPVIINDFEMVIEPQTAPDASKATDVNRKTEFTKGPNMRPEDIEQIMRRLMLRRARLRAD